MQGQHDLGEPLLTNRKEKARVFFTEVLRGITLINSGGGNVQRKIDGAGQTEGCKSRVWFLKPLGMRNHHPWPLEASAII